MFECMHAMFECCPPRVLCMMTHLSDSRASRAAPTSAHADAGLRAGRSSVHPSPRHRATQWQGPARGWVGQAGSPVAWCSRAGPVGASLGGGHAGNVVPPRRTQMAGRRDLQLRIVTLCTTPSQSLWQTCNIGRD